MEKEIRRSLKFLPFVLCFFCSLFLGASTAGAASEMFISKGETIIS